MNPSETNINAATFSALTVRPLSPDQLLAHIEALQARADARRGKPGYTAILHRLRAARIAALAVKS